MCSSQKSFPNKSSSPPKAFKISASESWSVKTNQECVYMYVSVHDALKDQARFVML